MNLVTIPWTRLDPGNALARAYLTTPRQLSHCFPVDATDPRSLRPLLDAKRERPRLGRLLAEYNREVGGSVENAARLEDGFCVVSGQQVGLLLGPAYTTWKLFTVINAAKEISRELKVDVVPVFWVESEDHDWDEVNRFFIGARRLRIEGHLANATPVGEIDVDPAAFLEPVRKELGEGEAWDLVAPERNVARWHVRNLARLVEGAGVVFLEPKLLREPMREFAGRIAGSSDAIDASLGRETGFEKALAPAEGAYLFDATAGRRRMRRGEGVPAAWSADVAARVLVQNAALPVLAAVCGPSEIRYWAQLRGAHEALGVTMPAVLPRNAATLIEAGPARDAARLGVSLEDVVRGTSRPPEAGGSEDPVATRLRRLALEAQELSGAVADGSLALPPNTEKPFHRTVDRLGEDLGKLAERLEAARADAEGVGIKRYERMLEALRPRGELQERTQSLFPFLLRHGPQLATRLRESFQPYEFGHYLVML